MDGVGGWGARSNDLGLGLVSAAGLAKPRRAADPPSGGAAHFARGGSKRAPAGPRGPTSGMVCSMPSAGDMGMLAAMRARASSDRPLGRLPMTAS